MIRRIDDSHEIDELAGRIRTLFTGNLHAPFTPALPYRCVLAPIALRLESHEFAAIAAAARAAGDSTMIFSVTERFPDLEGQDCEFSADSYDEYLEAARLPLEHVLLSPSDSWCVFFTTIDVAPAGASAPAFVDALRAGLPRESDPVAFVADVLTDESEGEGLGALPGLLAHLYGEGAVAGIIAAARASA